MAKKSIRLLLLDANVILQLHAIARWEAVVERCEVLITEAIRDEALYYEDASSGEQVEIDLQPDIDRGQIILVRVPLDVTSRFCERFSPTFAQKLDPGEAEALAHLADVQPACSICSADKIVWRTLGVLGLGEQGLSLEEVLDRIGMSCSVSRDFGRGYREQWTQRGFEEGLQGEGP